ncbi:MAG: Uncharacterized protein AWT59_2376 [Candidatus Gallionella acididurans]|uniref:Uncharacterized protein n=1 Tax=Candidatus Gallionella acididurans TaxID=1796491 RepID=A0A139BRA5_9PROT|nr:MAG: Uncharacterized protein AWT59_2376 [Candidatus Gallionella acididurans]
MKSDLNFQSVSNEINTILNADIQRLSFIYGSEATEGMKRFPIDSMPVIQNMRVLYDYVVEARLPGNFPIGDVLHELTDYFLVTVPHSPMIDLHSDQPIEGLCAWIVETAVARWGLDFEEIGSFTIKQIATLANMDERSVRNAANPKLADPLITVRGVDGKTTVAREDAIRWLEGRRSYKRTTFFDEAGGRDLIKDGFNDLLDLAQFIKQQAEKLSKSLDHTLQQAGLLKEYAEWIGAKRSEHVVFDLDHFSALAEALDINAEQKRDFILAVCKVFQKVELVWLEQKFQK